MKCYVTLIIVMLTVWDSTMGSESDHQSSSESHEHQPAMRCDNLTRESINVSDLFRITSFTMTHSISPIYNCTKAVFIKPISPEVAYSILVTSGSSVIYYDAKVTDCGKTVPLTDCSTGMTGTWHFYKISLESNTDGYFCADVCSSDGLSLQQFNCVSAGNSVNTELTDKVVPYIKRLNVPGADAIFDARANCPAPTCTFFP